MNSNELNDDIAELWNDTFDKEEVLAPLFFGEIKQNQLLFVGMNPSFSDKGFRDFLKGSKFESLAHNDFFKWSNVYDNKQAIEQVIEIDTYALEHHSYFPKLRKIAHDSNTPWQHADLFFYRQTNQSEFQKLILNKNQLSVFGEGQISIFSKYLHLSAPRCIVVINAKASEIFRDYFETQLTWDENAGHHNINLDGKIVPILFSSMLSGQRALDRWSLERLDWQIRHIMT